MAPSRRHFSARDLKVRVKTAKGRKLSSTRWLERQLNDPYVALAKEQGYRSRAAFKLIDIDDKVQFLKKNAYVVDLGSAPGGWSQVASQRTGSEGDDPNVIAIDYLEMDHITGVSFLKKDFGDDDAPAQIISMMKGRKANCVLSDMAAPTTGHRQTDHLRTTHLFELAMHFSYEILTDGGVFLSKVFRGGAENSLLQDLKQRFDTVAHVKPESSRKESPELYVLAQGFRG
jgi:23S rRNA (uridine2552-2'-O)-methyltransferase